MHLCFLFAGNPSNATFERPRSAVQKVAIIIITKTRAIINIACIYMHTIMHLFTVGFRGNSVTRPGPRSRGMACKR